LIVNEPPLKKSRWLKWTLIGCGGLLLIGAGIVSIAGYYFFKNPPIVNDPQSVEAVAQEILQFELPAGYKGHLASSMFGMKMAYIAAPDNPGPEFRGIVLMAMPGLMDTEQAQRQLRESMNSGSQRDEGDTEQRPSETFVVRNESVSAKVAVTSVADYSSPLFQYSFVLKNSSGHTVLMTVFGSEDEITHDWMQNVLNTVK
jgi:hypothetical protein